MASRQDNVGRASYIDALRGFAALTVVIAHLTITWRQPGPIEAAVIESPLRILWGGHQAVILFFVLSGFALTRMIDGMPGYSYGRYFCARVVRLYIPYLASLTIALAGYAVLKKLGFNWPAGWMDVVGPTSDTRTLVEHAMMIGPLDIRAINPPIWTIAEEMRISLIFPAILMLVKRFDFKAVMAAYATSLTIAWVGLRFNDTFPVWNAQLGPLIHYTTFFFLGSWLSYNVSEFGACVERKTALRWSLGILAALLYAYSFDSPWGYTARLLGDLSIGIASALVIVLCHASTVSLFAKPGAWLGRISFSVYLNHMLVLNMALIVLMPKHGAIAVWLATIPLALLVSQAMCTLFERPSIKLSRFFSKSRARKIASMPSRFSLNDAVRRRR
ncbi:acyltransferase family protein [Paraburkholderia lycopersici]|uniref:Peptidoglycan/LPS O-acetylase OafA/YrhL, contains acyltransferase and SGNH-hydrolase domains n=1 Tax=Paraburkholderia lycopersici TaxID=416944 RepID=A0A1G7A8G6_9BURK|nr:acyltransferase [Paraburkholderia lycopersici]SDE11070.1 Peptidoglycan/LPS O-acetylase OafA/YrhL, contains acyltransferase and SGNH-hydrolase domains [Paraburkholderia lycopersici]